MTDLPDTDTLKGLLTDATPGPWAVAYASGEINGGASGGYPVISMKQDTYDRATDTVQLDEIDVGNARLIALAPSLAARVIEQDARIARLKAALALLTDRSAGLVHAHHHGNGLEGWHNVVSGVDRAITTARAALEDGQ